MATPFKRICRQAVRQPCRPRRTQAGRTFTTTNPTYRAVPVASEPSNRFTQSLPESSKSSHKDDLELDPDFQDDNLSSMAHSELDQHRELREMVRIAAWEMPLLSTLHKSFQRPKRSELPLRWRYTTYMGEQHPAQNKVVVEFDVHDIQGLNHGQRLTLRKLAGVRYDPRTQKVKMSCESFDSQAQNKRYLGDIIAKLIAEVKDPNADTFADLPVDKRHVKYKEKLRFPKEWLLTEDRKAELEAKRREEILLEGQKVEQNLLVSGTAAIEEARKVDAAKVEEPVMVQARQGLPRGKLGKKEMGQQRGAQR